MPGRRYNVGIIFRHIIPGAAPAVAFLVCSFTLTAQFQETPPAPYPAAVARQRIRSLLQNADTANRQQTVATISTLTGMVTWYRDILDEELIAGWKSDGRANLPEIIVAMADARVASAVVDFSWNERRAATFQLAYAPMLGNLMERYTESGKTFLGGFSLPAASLPPASWPELTPSEAAAVCRILIDMPDTGTWRKSAQAILPHYREAAVALLNQDLNAADPEKKYTAQIWLSDLSPPVPPQRSTPATTRPAKNTPVPASTAPSAGVSNASKSSRPTILRGDAPDLAGGSQPAVSPSLVSPSPILPSSVPPSLLSKTDPSYSGIAQKLHVQGAVLLSVMVGEDGMAQDIKTIRSLGYGLDEKATEAVRKWRFNPGTVQGAPVKARAQVEVNFALANKGQATDYRWSPGPMVFAAEDGFVPPEVTGGSMTAKVTGTTDASAVLEFTVNADGTVKSSFQMIHGPEGDGQLLADSLASWKFRPATKGGQPVEATGRIRFVRGMGDAAGRMTLSLNTPPDEVVTAPGR